MEDDPVKRMYKAIAEEKQLEINKLEAEKGELERKIRRLEQEKSTVADKLDDVWTAINKLQKETRESGVNLEEIIIRNSARLQQENEEKFEAIKRQIKDGNDLLAQSLLGMNKFKEETRGYFQTAQRLQKKMRKDLTDVKEQVKSNTDNVHSLQLQITKVSSKVDQIQETVTNQEKRLGSIARTMDNISQQMKLKTILIMGGMDENNYARRTMTVLRTDRSDWIEFPLKLPYTLFGSGAVFLHNELYIVGGQHNPKALYKLDKNLEWKRLADMNVGREFIAKSCLGVNGHIWVFGGYAKDRNALKSVERYDPKEDKWTLMPDMSTIRTTAAAVFSNYRIIVCGGLREGTIITSSAECFLLETGEWTQFPPLPDYLGGHSLVSFENKLILMGGQNNNGYQKIVREMDPLQPNGYFWVFGERRDGGWMSLPPMKYSRGYFSGLVLDQEIYALGGLGDDEKILDRVEIFDGKSWRDGPSLPYRHWGHSAVVIPQFLADRLFHYKP